ncbi:hypothetical protein [Nocardia alni]|uniref:hypothetical protein n=1 Tax=Nocardia alni TaxID=2815723 RepID=UPI001C23C335|nr:hypothetical protein [Nocardia alni]
MSEVADRRRNVLAGVRTGIAVLAGLALVGGAAIAVADPPGQVQPGVTAPPVHPAPTTAVPAPTPGDQSAELHSAQPQQNNSESTPYYRHYSQPKKTPTPTPSPTPRQVHIGNLAAPVPGVVPDAVVNGVNQTNQDFQKIIKPSTTPQPNK